MTDNIIRLVPPGEPPKKKNAHPKNTLPDGRKRVRVDIGKDPETGKRRFKAFYGKSLKEARDKRDAWLAAQKAAPLALSAQTVREWAVTWRAVYGSDAGYSQARTIEIDVRRLCAYMGQMQLRDVQQVHVQAYAQTVAHYAKSTVSKIKTTTQRIFAAALANGYILRDPCAGVKWAHAGEGTHRFLEPWEIQVISANWREHHAGIWALLMLYAGLRRGEALALRWEDIDGDVIHVRHGVHFESNEPVLGDPKTPAAVRDIPVAPQLREALQSAPRACPFVCTSADGRPVSGSAWARGWAAWNHAMQRAAGRPFSVRAHDLRHTFASMLYDAGVDIKTAQLLLGHTSPELTMRIYTHLSDTKKAANLDRLNAYFSELWSKSGSDSQKSQ